MNKDMLGVEVELPSPLPLTFLVRSKGSIYGRKIREMTSLSKKAQKTSQAIDTKIQQLKNKQYALETKMVLQLHRALKSHQGFSLPFPTLMGGLIEVMEQIKANSNHVEAWNVSGAKFLRQRIKQQSKSIPSENSPAVSAASATMENPHDQA